MNERAHEFANFSEYVRHLIRCDLETQAPPPPWAVPVREEQA